MEAGQAASFLPSAAAESSEEWENGQAISQSAAPSSSLELVQSLGQSAEELQQVYSIVECDYNMGDMDGYTHATLGNLMLLGVAAGFGLAFGLALLCYGINKISLSWRKIVEAG